MDYRETIPPAELHHLVKVGWTLDVPTEAPEWTKHVATPDGCMEIIRRLEGRSRWGEEQPAAFVAGVITRPTELELARSSRFVGVRLWPWAWRALTGCSPAELTDRWADFGDYVPAPALPATVLDLFNTIALVRNPPDRRFTEAVIAARSCASLISVTGISPRALQRWFERNVGQPPRLWLRLLRFSGAFAELPQANASLAEHAAGHGYADQAHMSREFKSLAGTQVRRARSQGRGPFLTGE